MIELPAVNASLGIEVKMLWSRDVIYYLGIFTVSHPEAHVDFTTALKFLFIASSHADSRE